MGASSQFGQFAERRTGRLFRLWRLQMGPHSWAQTTCHAVMLNWASVDVCYSLALMRVPLAGIGPSAVEVVLGLSLATALNLHWAHSSRELSSITGLLQAPVPPCIGSHLLMLQCSALLLGRAID